VGFCHPRKTGRKSDLDQKEDPPTEVSFSICFGLKRGEEEQNDEKKN